MLRLNYAEGMSDANLVAALIQGDARLHDAIILPEPGYISDALPYYVPNDIYLTRERRFGRYAFPDLDGPKKPRSDGVA